MTITTKTNAESVLELNDVTKTFSVRNRTVRALGGVSLAIRRGETVGLIGESGSGKSTIGRIALGMTPPDEGSVAVNGVRWRFSARADRPQRANISMVFQDPGLALNPRMTVAQSIAEPIRLHRPEMPKQKRESHIRDLVACVHLPQSVLDRYPGQLSGGQQQRVGIARAIATEAKLIVLDEPTASLDAHVGAEVLGMLAELQKQLSIAYLLISHDMRTIHRLAERVVVLYRGVIVESGRTEDVLREPVHPYTRALISAVLAIKPEQRAPWYRLSGIPVIADAAEGCVLYGRCPEGDESCTRGRIPTTVVGGDHTVACVKSDLLTRPIATERSAGTEAPRSGDAIPSAAPPADAGPGAQMAVTPPST